MTVYQVGDGVTVFETFTKNDVLTNPTTVTFTVEKPDETIDTFVFGVAPEVTNPSVGRFELSYLPLTAGTYNYRVVGTGTVVAAAEGAFAVQPSAIGATSGIFAGPCEPWIDSEDVANCCSVQAGSNFWLFDAAALSASQLLYELSARQFSGVCTRTVRPCESRSCGFQVLQGSLHVIDWGGYWMVDHWEPRVCDCQAVSRVVLPNFPVRAITQVKIDGAVIAASGYRLDGQRYLTRLADATGDPQSWPTCQRLDLADTAAGTFTVTYQFGQPVPEAGLDAAAQLGCEIYKSCPGNSGVGDCVLPKGTTRVTRQGITVEMKALRYDSRLGWQTGMNLVDAFLNAYNPRGLRRKPAIWSPDHRLPEEVGV